MGKRIDTLMRYTAITIVIWTAALVGSLLWNVHRERAQTHELAKRDALAVLSKDEVIRFWAVSHEAVYVPIISGTSPNPNLSHIPERDIHTPSGRTLTLMNHANMMKEIMHGYAEQSGIKGRITSLKPFSAENAPDEWEREALESFERGAKDASKLFTSEGEPYLTVMKPVIATKACLKCHGVQGYQEGDVRGGIEVSIPLTPLRGIERRNIMALATSHGLIWLLGVLVIGTGSRRIKHFFDARVEAAGALRESEKKFTSIFNAINDAVFIHDFSGQILEVNDQCCRRLGYTREELLRLSLHELVASEHSSRIGEGLRGLREQGHVLFETELVAKGGTRIPIEVNARIIEIEGRPAVASVQRDITDRKRMEQEILKGKQLESLGVLAGGIAHDFNNLLQGILGSISLAKISLRPEDKAYQLLDRAEGSYKLAANLTNQLITFSRGGAPVKSVFLIGELIRDAAQFALSGANVKCEFRISDSCCPVEADEGQMRQVIQNMVINAKEAMPGGGLLQIRAEEVHLREKEVPPLKGGKYAEISVEDHGIGIPKENLSRIFEPYVTTKEMGTQKGLGLGLAICYSIVKNHGGHITVESEIGRGTVFHIYLSIAEGRPGVEEGEKMVPAAGKGRVLIMDDEKAVTDVAEELLSLAGYEIVVTKDGTEAIRVYEKAREQGNPFDVVILDLTIPGGMGGLETMKRLCVIDHSVKGIVSSGYSEDPVLNEYESYGFKGSLVKPYTIETLRETVDRVIGTK